uniref:RNA helicase n=1 Tax=Chromera velia CCMP2878 TaxID=1169474 RepID=A0A0G4HIV1_9ALVE|mmetsp:Transcript_33129/g.65771  ORF Transcript_33129/g.65771 Transcript_33129/m.65771 type:complete len:521 (+) Transcript_33129:240-1802(+)|eukprot:Cvel_7047.t1-p1 / transcript=Cvel_7047.t1 / gene=Cvel_7047 / organism=Chromera_velia_CCMP2878 / gene_product=ATP-dependent RNA helicase dbp5, putative / transcript_product=ATP-dependent RNA helicase dbp5, putative / location=Cvel_scaffold360:1720-4792(+) / protein_length=520 / sequence_SO=supercontig / SO=protein_coding / is_pseudo=false
MAEQDEVNADAFAMINQFMKGGEGGLAPASQNGHNGASAAAASETVPYHRTKAEGGFFEPGELGSAPKATPSAPSGGTITHHVPETAQEARELEEKVVDKRLVGEDTAKVRVDRAAGLEHLQAVSDWDQLNLSPELLKGIYEKNFIRPSKIQEAALPLILGSDTNMIGQAQNGSGKTATFALAMLAKVDPGMRCTQAIVISPTRELAIQNAMVTKELGKHTGISIFALIPDIPKEQFTQQNINSQILSGTPGKLEDLVFKRKRIDTAGMKMLVVDEADVLISPANGRMHESVQNCRKMMHQNVQVLLFSATFATEEIRKWAMQMAPAANKIIVQKEELTLTNISQRFKQTEDKFSYLTEIYECMGIGQSVIFVNRREEAFALAKRLQGDGHPVTLICGTQTRGEEKMDAKLRDQVLAEFRAGESKILIATDVLARGIDVPAVTLVVNYDLPQRGGGVEMATYIHRIGRTGRFGAKGVAVNLVTQREMAALDSIRSYYQCEITEMPPSVEAFEEELKNLRK